MALTLGYPVPALEAAIVQAESGCSADVAEHLRALALGVFPVAGLLATSKKPPAPACW